MASLPPPPTRKVLAQEDDDEALFRAVGQSISEAGSTIGMGKDAPGAGLRPPFVEPPIEPAFRLAPPRLWSPLRELLGRAGESGYNPPRPPPPRPPPEAVLKAEWGEPRKAPRWAQELADKEMRRQAGQRPPPPRVTSPQGGTPRSALSARSTALLEYAPLEAELAGAAAPYAGAVASDLLAPALVAGAATLPLAYGAYRAWQSATDPNAQMIRGLEDLAGQHGQGKILDMADVDPSVHDWLRAHPDEARRLANRGIIGADLLLYAEQVEPIKGVWPSGKTTAARIAGPEEWMPSWF